jgi:CoA-transferase family III
MRIVPPEPSNSPPYSFGQLGQRWAESGAMSLTGTATGSALGCPAGVVEVLELASHQLAEHSRRLAKEVVVDGLALLGERAALLGLSRQGSISCGGSTRLLETSDGHLALCLARPDDLALLPAFLGEAFSWDSLSSNDESSAWFEPPSASNATQARSAAIPAPPTNAAAAQESMWSNVAAIVKGVRSQELVDRGVELGLALGALPNSPIPSNLSHHGRNASLASDEAPWDRKNSSTTTDERSVSIRIHEAVIGSKLQESRSFLGDKSGQIRVVDLSSLWAGPLCGQLLAAAGCEVIKVESTSRPDGARLGSPEFFDLLNGNKRSVSLDFAYRENRRALIDLLASADVVIEASRPRALDQLGIDRRALLAESGVSVWLQITGHGAHGNDANRVGFGDDAAVSGGLVAWDGDQPVFCADAIADPATGLLAASAVLKALDAGGHWLLDASLCRTAQTMASGPMVAWQGGAASPKARPVSQRAPAFGADTHSIISALSSGEPTALIK